MSDPPTLLFYCSGPSLLGVPTMVVVIALDGTLKFSASFTVSYRETCLWVVVCLGIPKVSGSFPLD